VGLTRTPPAWWRGRGMTAAPAARRRSITLTRREGRARGRRLARCGRKRGARDRRSWKGRWVRSARRSRWRRGGRAAERQPPPPRARRRWRARRRRAWRGNRWATRDARGRSRPRCWQSSRPRARAPPRRSAPPQRSARSCTRWNRCRPKPARRAGGRAGRLRVWVQRAAGAAAGAQAAALRRGGRATPRGSVCAGTQRGAKRVPGAAAERRGGAPGGGACRGGGCSARGKFPRAGAGRAGVSAPGPSPEWGGALSAAPRRGRAQRTRSTRTARSGGRCIRADRTLTRARTRQRGAGAGRRGRAGAARWRGGIAAAPVRGAAAQARLAGPPRRPAPALFITTFNGRARTRQRGRSACLRAQ
jgi:hypothetical protein